MRVLYPFVQYTGGDREDMFSSDYYLYGVDGGDGKWQVKEQSVDLGLRQVPRYVVPAALNQEWDSPFFFEDRRYLFYVTSTPTQFDLRSYNGYGILPTRRDARPRAAPSIPPLSLRHRPEALPPNAPRSR
jgi:hypothetical protein